MQGIDREERINESWTVGEFIDSFEGEEFTAANPNEPQFTCDFCSKGVSYSSKPRVGMYIADDVLNREHPVWQKHQRSDGSTIVPLASYCEDCTTQLLFFPCRGFGEVRAVFDLTPEKVQQNVKVTDISSADDGVPWNPKELSERITGVAWEEQAMMSALSQQDHLWGPENMVTYYLSTVEGVDIRELVQWDGSIDPKQLGQARKKYDEFMRKLEASNSSNPFRDHMKSKR